MASIEEDDSVYIELSKNPIRFEPVSKVTNVFFDDSNRQASIYQYISFHTGMPEVWTS